MSVQQAIITLVSAIVSGVLATFITLAWNSHLEMIRMKQELVYDIFGFKYQLMGNNLNSSPDIYPKGFSYAMSRVPVVFDKDREVLDAYDKLYDVLSISDSLERSKKADEALICFLKAICKSANIKCDNWNDSRFARVFTVGK